MWLYALLHLWYAQYVLGTSMPIIRSSRLYVCYCRLWCAVLGCWLSGVRCRTAGCASRKRDAAASLFLDAQIWQHKYDIAHLRWQHHNSKFVIFQERLLKVLKCCNFLWVQRRRNCSPAASFAYCVMTLYLLKVHLQTFFSIPITQKCKIWVVTLLSQMSNMNLGFNCKIH